PIAAGPELLRMALSDDTAQLPDVALFMPADVISGTSEDAVRAGIMVGFAEGCMGIIRRITDQLDGETTVVFSGGWGRYLANETGPESIYRPNNLLDGLVKLLEMNG
ncbi:MAG: type III pantothenate kinase, partial [Rhodothermales bacterium]|nr:type III pantothenate kinase [Rhodothermales bacterium]